jgi:cytochrome P450
LPKSSTLNAHTAGHLTVTIVGSTLLFTGHSPSALSLIWYLWEIAKHPEAQDRIRAEIATTHAERGGRELSIADLDSMTFTQATLKVC